MPRFVSVAVPVPALDLLTYAVPEGLDAPCVGARVLVPLGARRLTGIVVRANVAPPDADQPVAVKDVIDVLDGGAFLPSTVVELGQWAADYYACGPGEAIGAAMPPFAWVESEWRVRLTQGGVERVGTRHASARSTLRESILSLLADGAWSSLRSIAYRLEHAGGGRRGRGVPARAAVRVLQEEGLVEIEDRTQRRLLEQGQQLRARAA